MATTIYAIGMHKESKGSNLPVFLLETRRRIFCAAYNNDKVLSTFLGRPPRLSKRYTDIKLPLDLSDPELTADEAALDLSIRNLDADGWNTKGEYYRATWIRLRYISSGLREEILDFALSKIDANVERQLLDISRRIHETWETLPSHCRYWPTCWDDGLMTGDCLMLVVVYLSMYTPHTPLAMISPIIFSFPWVSIAEPLNVSLPPPKRIFLCRSNASPRVKTTNRLHLTDHYYSEFMVQKLLDRPPLVSNTALLRVSMDLLTTCLTLSRIHDRNYEFNRDFLNTILIIGIPTGSVLLSALQAHHKTSQPFPPSISRAEIIRTLSVLIMHLDTAARFDTRCDTNFDLCVKASRMFTRIIDAVLDPAPQTAVAVVGAEEVAGGGNLDLDLDLDLDLGLNVFGAPVLTEGFGGMEGMVGSLYDGVDWGAVGQWTF
jgi:hypothetical protein